MTNDRKQLRTAFSLLRQRGIYARWNAPCCNTCASEVTHNEIRTLPESEREKLRGYTFFHDQDVELSTDGIHLAFGALDETDNTAVAIAETVVSTLDECGLRTNWNGSTDQKVKVHMTFGARRSA